jgi:hypothetical protein
MTTSRKFSDSEGTFSGWLLTTDECPKCKERNVRVRTWESNDGAYEDYQFQCFALTCGHAWWVDGPDS